MASTILNFNNSIIIGALIIIILTILTAFAPTKVSFRIIFWTGVIEIAATIIFFAINAMITPAQFQAAFDYYAGQGAYNNVITQAEANGLTYPPGFQATLMALPIAWYAFTWYTLPTTWSGEMRQVKKSLPIAILLALAIILTFYLTFYGVSFYSFGEKFLTAWSYDLANGFSTPFSDIGTYTPFFVTLVYTNPVIPILGLLVFWLPDVIFFIPTIIGATRYLFAWSFDRMAPEIFSRVSPKSKVPTYATILIGSIALAGLLAYAYIPQVGIIDIIPFFDFSFILPALTAILLPYYKKELYEQAFVAKKKFIGIPVISWMGGIALAGIIYGIIGLWGSTLMPINLTTGIAIFAVYFIGGMIFLGMYITNKRKGINIKYAFQEIPPE